MKNGLDSKPLNGTLKEFQPLDIRIANKTELEPTWDFMVKQYHAALNIWHPLIAFHRETPRELKRFQNQARFYAMRFYPEDNHKVADIRIDDILVALFALYDYEPEIICKDALWAQIKGFFNNKNEDLTKIISDINQPPLKTGENGVDDSKKDLNTEHDPVLQINDILSQVLMEYQKFRNNRNYQPEVTDDHRNLLLEAIGGAIIRT
jgi:hypothetical protein